MDVIRVEKREASAKPRQLRRAGQVPCVVYGGALEESVSIQMEQAAAVQLLRRKRQGSKAQLKLEGKTISVQLKDIVKNFVNNEITHISFEALSKDKKVNSVAHIALANSELVEGTLEQMLFEIPYSALPADMIDVVTIDMTDRPVGTVITVGDLPEFQSEKVSLLTDAEGMILRISDKKRAPGRGAEPEPAAQ